MSRKVQKKRKDELCDPGLEKKQRSIAMTALEQFHDYAMTTVPSKINALLESIERVLPEGVTMVRDEPLSDKSGPEQIGFALGPYYLTIQLCKLRKGNSEIIVSVETDHLFHFNRIGFTSRISHLGESGHFLTAWLVDFGYGPTKMIEEQFRLVSERREPPIGCADSATKTHVPLK